MRVYRVKLGYQSDSSGGFGFGMMMLFYPIIASIIATGCIYAAYLKGVFDEEDEDKA